MKRQEERLKCHQLLQTLLRWRGKKAGNCISGKKKLHLKGAVGRKGQDRQGAQCFPHHTGRNRREEKQQDTIAMVTESIGTHSARKTKKKKERDKKELQGTSPNCTAQHPRETGSGLGIHPAPLSLGSGWHLPLHLPRWLQVKEDNTQQQIENVKRLFY